MRERAKVMKIIRKISVLLMVVLLIALTMVPALAAYTPVTVTGNPQQKDSATTITHTLTLTEQGNSFLPYGVNYTFTVGDPTVEEPSGVVTPSNLVVGKPTISPVTYAAGTFTDVNTEGKYYKSNTLTVDWSGVTIKEPGIYKWTVSETMTMNPTTAEESASAHLNSGYLIAYAIDNNGTLEFKYWYFNNGTDKGNIEDTYPATTHDLAVSKTVTGDLGSKTQYFKFTVSVTLPAGIPAKDYNLTGTYETNVPATSYNAAQTNPTTANIAGGTAKDIVVWLKHGQNVVINDLPAGTTYTVNESENAGYTVAGLVTEATELDADHTVGVTNSKTGTTPTGVFLQYGAPIAGIVTVAALFAVVIATRRKRSAQ